MRLPFIQVDAQFFETGAADLAELLGLTEAVAGWAMVKLWGYVVNKATSPDGLGMLVGPDAQRLAERAAGWRGTSGTFLGALCNPAIGLADLSGDTVVLRGLERYAATFKKNARDAARMSQRRAQVAAESRRRSGVDVDVDVEEETSSLPAMPGAGAGEDLPQADEHAELVESEGDVPPGCVLEAVEAPPLRESRPALVLVSQEPESKPQRAPSAQETLYANLQDDRRKRCEAAGKRFVDDDWKPQAKNTQFRALVRATEAEQLAFADGWDAYLADDFPGGLDLPWSLTVFMRQRARWESKAANAMGGVK